MTKSRNPSATRKPAGNSKASAAHRERLFVDAYIANGENGAQAAIAAGFSEKTARQIAAQLLKRPGVQQTLKERRDSLERKYALTTEAVIEKLAKLIHADVRDLYNEDGTLKDPKDWPDDVAMAVTGFEATEELEGHGNDRKFVGMRKKIRIIDPTSSIQLAMRRLGLFKDDNEQSRQVTKVVMVPAKRAAGDD